MNTDNNLQEYLSKAAKCAQFLSTDIVIARYYVIGLPDSPSNRIAEKYLLGLIEDSKKIENALKCFVAKP